MYGTFLSNPTHWGLLRRAIGFALVWSLATGAVFIPGVWAATFFVDDSGDDGRTPTEAQNPATPWKTITRAITEPTLDPGDDIQVGAGAYDQALGEIFPLYLVDGVALIGDPDNPDSRVIDPPPGADAFVNDNTALDDGTALAGFRINHDTGLTGDSGMKFLVGSVAMAPEISGNVFVGNAGTNVDGIHIEDRDVLARSFTGLVSGNTFADLDAGIELSLNQYGTPADFSPTLRGNTFTDCNYPINVWFDNSFSGIFSPEIVGNTATGSNSDIEMEINIGSGHGPTFAPLISNNTFSGSSGDSIALTVYALSLSTSTDTLTFSPTILNNTITDAGDEGMYFYFDDVSSCNFESDMTIAGNTITNPGGNGIYLEMASFSYANSIFVDWTISNNTIAFGAAGASDGIEIEATSYLNYLDGGHLNLTVAGNTITGASAGIYISLSSFTSTEIGLSMTIQGNTITGSMFGGISIDVTDQSSFTASRTDIIDNVLDSNLGDGLQIDMTYFTWPTSYVQVACNTIINNGGHGVRQWNDSYAPPSDYGGGDLGSPGLNTFVNNGGYDFYNYHTDTVAAHNNWWGTTDTGTIDANIFDAADDSYPGVVDYSGYLSAAPTVSATATLVDALEIDLSPPGPSNGDTFRYTAMLEGTGDCGCASALFTVPIPENGFFIPDSLGASRGILINDAVNADHPELLVGLGALEAGETVTITWDVMVWSGCSMTSQATLSCYQLGDVLTDDPDVGGGNDPTTIVFEGSVFCDGFESGDIDLWSNAVP